MDKIQIVDLLIEHYPELKKNRTNLIKIVLQKITRPNKLILEKVLYDNNIYYKYNDGILIDQELNICGYCYINKNDKNDINIINSNKIFIIRKYNRKEKYNSFLREMDEKMKK